MNLATDMGRHSGRATPSLHDTPYRNIEEATADDPLIFCQSLCRQTEPPLAPHKSDRANLMRELARKQMV